MASNDTFTGIAGAETFVFGRDNGSDVINGFGVDDDVIDLTAFAIFDLSALTLTSNDTGVTIDLTAVGGGSIFLQGVNIDDLDAANFLFSRLDGGGTAAEDKLQADNDGDRVDGGDGDDTITGGRVGDILIGGTGSDTIYGGGGQDTIDGGVGDDALYGDAGGDVIRGGAGDDIIHGGTEADSLAGGEGNDTLYGGSGDDFLEGHAGDDIVEGGTGDDEMYGDGGADTFVFGPGHGDDTIRDFTTGEDKIDLTEIAGVWGLTI